MAITRAQQARQMLKKAKFVVQDGFKNYIKNSESVTVPKEFKSREDATPTKLAYITKDEAKMLKKMKKAHRTKDQKVYLVMMITMRPQEVLDLVLR